MARKRKWAKALIAEGWRLDRHCTCGSVYREYWRHAKLVGYEITIWPDSGVSRTARVDITLWDRRKAKFDLSELATALDYEPFKKVKEVTQVQA